MTVSVQWVGSPGPLLMKMPSKWCAICKCGISVASSRRYFVDLAGFGLTFSALGAKPFHAPYTKLGHVYLEKYVPTFSKG